MINMEIKDIFEMVFNIAYMVFLWGLVYKMFNSLDSKNIRFTKTVAWTFALLAIGDTGHVGFRVIAYLKGGIAANALFVGMGKFATSVTLTIFYCFFIIVWKLRFDKKFNNFTYLLFGCALIRLIILALPGNQWGSMSAPFDWAIYRNIPFWILGLGADYLILSSALKAKDKTFKWIGIMILISFGFYTPVVLFAHKTPIIGALMIPKTVAYLAAAFIAYYGVFKRENLKTTNREISC
ncbi:MAG: hypothetical protein KAX49_12760 [Halanaerobiales bacterium]|nr:hypothetical protein [Halanaerobiales bacterium]